MQKSILKEEQEAGQEPRFPRRTVSLELFPQEECHVILGPRQSDTKILPAVYCFCSKCVYKLLKEGKQNIMAVLSILTLLYYYHSKITLLNMSKNNVMFCHFPSPNKATLTV